MLDGFVRPLIDPPFDHMARWLAARHVSADSLTWLGLAIGLAVVPTIVAERYLTGLLLILANRLLDGFDGAVAGSCQGLRTALGRSHLNAFTTGPLRKRLLA